ncbi:DNA endonuclease RBBP8-like protein [Leptotrombidium deliense]|uniref:DNA endonuclease RBBP8-like protein n=1 Tax=Leptotrombidium deliense TaxID=299467 RepID=A0A443SIQ3_9ACAR|nr:DNA endonuclease RBBP8-like protein [Leptotrombidium deliense]
MDLDNSKVHDKNYSIEMKNVNNSCSTSSEHQLQTIVKNVTANDSAKVESEEEASTERLKVINQKRFTKQNLAPKDQFVRALKAPVRKKEERKLLGGYKCKECADYYSTFKLSHDQLRHKLNKCSRHRYDYSPPKTPPHFWDIDYFPDLT